jgi:hypothetical protein
LRTHWHAHINASRLVSARYCHVSTIDGDVL